MSRPGGIQNDEVARGAGVQLAKGAGLILGAIVIGIVLLQIVDDGRDGSVGADATRPRNTTTTSATEPSSTGSTTGSTGGTPQPAREPAQVPLIVLNAGAPAGTAGELSDTLETKGYTNQEEATDWTGGERDGTAVFCKAGLNADAVALATAVQDGLQPQAWPEPAPPNSGNVDCVVAVGAS
jgi:hypothetical protein